MPDYSYPTHHITIIKKLVSSQRADASLKIWENNKLDPVKSKLKLFIRTNRTDGNKCSYCLKDFYNDHNMSIDIEHILPKSKYPEYTFTLKNLTIACKRCNLIIKGNDTSFLTDDFERKKPFKRKYYKITHPVLDRKNHLLLFDLHYPGNHIIKYYPKNTKAQNTYTYFRLNEIEIEILNQAQGISPIIDFLSAGT